LLIFWRCRNLRVSSATVPTRGFFNDRGIARGVAESEGGRDRTEAAEAADRAYERFFPYDDPYENQREAMDRIYGALAGGRDVLFEGACGTGKTLSALVPALEYADRNDKTVVITTSVHQQTRQFVEEARAITRQEPIRAVVFRGKGSMCHVDVGYEECQTLRDSTRELADAEADLADLEDRASDLLERSQAGDEEAAAAHGSVVEAVDDLEDDLDDLRDAATCDHYYRNLTDEAATGEFYAWLHDDVRTPEEVYEFAGDRGLCGYELLKEGMDGVDLVVCNYHHLLDPFIREQFFRWLGRDPGDVITVFDEAHNVEAAARDHATRTLTEPTLDAALDELAGVDDPRADRAENVVAAFRSALVDTYEDGLGFGGVGEDWEDVAVENDDGRDDLTLAFLREYTGKGIDADLDAAADLGADVDEEYERAYREGEATTRAECRTLQVAEFLTEWMADSDDRGHLPMVSVRRDAGTGEVYGRAELYACIPRTVTGSLFGEVHASVLMSATLRPFDVAADVLDLEAPDTLAYGLTFPPEHRRTLAVETPALFASERDDPDVQATVADALRDVVEFTPGNVLAFFPSYAESERYADRLDGEGIDATVHRDRAGVGAQQLREEFVAGDDGLLVTSLWGTLSEGVSFDGDDARTVVVVGVPYPHLDDRAEAVQAAYDALADGPDAGWRYAVEIPTIRKTRQALGRVVRGPEEVGARVLLDERYTARASEEMGEYGVRSTFPEEERAEIVDVAPAKAKFSLLNFFADHGAYGGDPPAP
jgi:DNA excision repair protein ERCC-2